MSNEDKSKLNWVVYHRPGAEFIKTWNFNTDANARIIWVSSIEEKASDSNTGEFKGHTELLEDNTSE